MTAVTVFDQRTVRVGANRGFGAAVRTEDDNVRHRRSENPVSRRRWIVRQPIGAGRQLVRRAASRPLKSLAVSVRLLPSVERSVTLVARLVEGRTRRVLLLDCSPTARLRWSSPAPRSLSALSALPSGGRSALVRCWRSTRSFPIRSTTPSRLMSHRSPPGVASPRWRSSTLSSRSRCC